MSKHTPGPWRWNVSKLESQTGQMVCRLPEYDHEGPGNKAEQEATQRLLICAPYLLAALQMYVDHGDCAQASVMARAAIAKAEGK